MSALERSSKASTDERIVGRVFDLTVSINCCSRTRSCTWTFGLISTQGILTTLSSQWMVYLINTNMRSIISSACEALTRSQFLARRHTHTNTFITHETRRVLNWFSSEQGFLCWLKRMLNIRWWCRLKNNWSWLNQLPPVHEAQWLLLSPG